MDDQPGRYSRIYADNDNELATVHVKVGKILLDSV